MRSDAKVMGYGVVGAEEVLDVHSWQCHGYADEVRGDLGIRLTDNGLIPEVSTARSMLSWMLARLRAQAPKPVPWTVVCLVVESPDPDRGAVGGTGVTEVEDAA